MGIFIRKSIKVGPFRFNLSRSGVGVSVGVRGLRVGTGPRGNYVHMGGGGLYYRATLPSGRGSSRARTGGGGRNTPSAPPGPAREDFERIESGDVLAMTDESAAGLLQQIRDAQGRGAVMPWALGGTAIMVLLALVAGAPGWLVLAAAALGAGATAWARFQDEAKRAVVVFYDLEPDARAAFEELHAAFARLAGAKGAWNVEARAETDDRKRNAGATRLVVRKPVRLEMGVPAVIRTNLDVPAIPCGQETLYFFPDRLLVSSPRGIGAVPYEQLNVTVESGPFVEDGSVPADASEIGTTWRYVNRDGGPDRRFADNRQLPILLYEQVTFTSRAGLHEVLQLSRTGGGQSFRSAVETLARLARARGEGSSRPPGGGEPGPAAAAVAPAAGAGGTLRGGGLRGRRLQARRTRRLRKPSERKG